MALLTVIPRRTASIGDSAKPEKASVPDYAAMSSDGGRSTDTSVSPRATVETGLSNQDFGDFR
jgi:hypothetical protein